MLAFSVSITAQLTDVSQSAPLKDKASNMLEFHLYLLSRELSYRMSLHKKSELVCLFVNVITLVS